MAMHEKLSGPEIFVISLHDASDRRKPLLDALTLMGHKFRLHSAIDGRDCLPQRYEAMIDRPRTVKTVGRALSDGEYACALSHLSVYQTIVAEGISDAIVLEDDAQLLEGFREAALTKMPDWADLLLFDHAHAVVNRYGSRALFLNARAYRISYQMPTLATGYRLSGKTAERMIALSIPLCQPADWPCDILAFRTFAMWPKLVGNNNSKDGHSHLKDDRDHLMVTSRKNEIQKPARSKFLKFSYLKRKLTARKLS